MIFLFCRNPNCKGNLNRGKSKETYKYSKGFCHEGHLIEHLKSSHECEQIYEEEGLVSYKPIGNQKIYNLTTSTSDTYHLKNLKISYPF